MTHNRIFSSFTMNTLQNTERRKPVTINQKDLWLKAAVIGSLWGAAEIVLGSFLHNLRIPFSGNMLTAIGIVLMISGHRLWPERGIIFRAGLICAALKTLSPSPVLLGPMLSIFMQASLMELAVSAGRKTLLGYIIGGGLAMSWNLLYRIFSSIVIYGGPLIALYQNLVNFLNEQTGLTVEGYWTPILILWALFFLFGAFVAVIGIFISKKANKTAPFWDFSAPAKGTTQPIPEKNNNASVLIRPIILLACLTGGLYSIIVLPVIQTVGVLGIFLFVVWLYNKRLIYRFAKKRGYWISILVLLGLSSYFMGNVFGFSIEGLKVGGEMVMRATYVITGFSVISSELRNPALVGFFRGKNMDPFLSAVRISFQTTPLLISNIPGKQAWRRPAKVLGDIIGSMEQAFYHLREQTGQQPKVFIVTGAKGSGKTTLLRDIVHHLKASNIQPEGFLAPAIETNGKRTGYKIRDVNRDTEMPLCQREEVPNKAQPGPFRFNPDGIHFGERILQSASSHQADILIIDELGPFELNGQGWDPALSELKGNWNKPMLWVIRESLTSAITDRYGATVMDTFSAGQISAEEAANAIIQQIKNDETKQTT